MDAASNVKHLRMPDGTVLILEQEGEGATAIVSLGVRLPAMKGYAVLIVHPRGHGDSEGRWHAQKHNDDVEFLLRAFRRLYGKIYLVAAGEQARLLLLQEREETVFPDGMVLLHPASVEKIHVQTPTVIFTNLPFTHVLNVTVRAWPESNFERLHAFKEGLALLNQSEVPIRFRAR